MKLSKKVISSTLVEVIIAMTILLTVAGICLIIFQRSLESNSNELRMAVFLKTEQLIKEHIEEPSYKNQTFEYPGFSIEKECMIENNLYTLSYSAKNTKGMLLYNKKLYININDQE